MWTELKRLPAWVYKRRSMPVEMWVIGVIVSWYIWLTSALQQHTDSDSIQEMIGDESTIVSNTTGFELEKYIIWL